MASDDLSKLDTQQLEYYLAESLKPEFPQAGPLPTLPDNLAETKIETQQPVLPETRIEAPQPELSETRVAAPVPELPDAAPRATGWEDIPVTNPNERGWWDEYPERYAGPESDPESPRFDQSADTLIESAAHPSPESSDEIPEATAVAESVVRASESDIPDILMQILRVITDALREMRSGGGQSFSQPPSGGGAAPSMQTAEQEFPIRDPRQNEYFPTASPSVQSSTLAGIKGAGGYGFGSMPSVPGFASGGQPSKAMSTRFAQPEGGVE